MAEDKQSPSEENAKLALSLARHMVAASAAAKAVGVGWCEWCGNSPIEFDIVPSGDLT